MRDVVSIDMQSRAGVIAYQAGSRRHGCRIGYLQQKRLETLSIFAVLGRHGRDPTVPLHRDCGE